jgi:anti-anti-sigma regulatory factor
MAHTLNYELPEQLTVANVQTLHEQLEHMVDDAKNDHIVLQASGVQRADTAGIQLLYALVVAAKERQITLSWDNPSEKLRIAAQILGMSEQLGIH